VLQSTATLARHTADLYLGNCLWYACPQDAASTSATTPFPLPILPDNS